MILLNSSRTALYHVLKSQYNEFKNKKILIPSFTCHTVTDVIKKANINFEYYDLSDNFKIEFNKIEEKLKSNNFFAIIGTNYFGFPYFINDFLNMSYKYGILYFEDNSHGLGSSYNNFSLGTFGDYGFTSITKHIRLQSGGVLNIKSEQNFNNLRDQYLPRENIKFIKFFRYYINSNLPNFIKTLIKNMREKLIFDDPYLYKDNNFSYSKIDKFSEIIFNNYNIEKLRKSKLKNYKFWENEINKKFNLQPLFEIKDNINPWCIPYLIKNIEKKNDIIDFVEDKKGTCFTWPSLPNTIINKNDITLDIWKRLLCISTMDE